MQNVGDVLNLRPDPFEVDAKRIWVWEVWFVDEVTKQQVKRGVLRTLDRNPPPAERSWDGIPHVLMFANEKNMQAVYRRKRDERQTQ